MKRILLVISIFVTSLFTMLSQSSPLPGLDLYRQAEVFSMQMSPNGRYIAYFQETNGTRILHTLDMQKAVRLPAMRIPSGLYVSNITWLSNRYLMIHGDNDTKSPVLLEVDNRLIPRAYQNDVKIAGPFNTDKNEIIVYKDRVGLFRYLTDLYAISIEDLIEGNFNEMEPIERSIKNVIGITYLASIRSLFLDRYINGIRHLEYRKISDKRFKKIKLDFDYAFKAIAKGSTNDLAVLTNKDSDTIGLYEFDINEGEIGEEIYSNPDFDLTGAFFNANGSLSWVRYTSQGKSTIKHFANADKSIKRLEKAFPDSSLFVKQATSDRTISLLAANASDMPTRYYYFDSKRKVIELVASAHPILDHLSFSKSSSFSVNTDDGLTIDAFITKPISNSNKTLLVMPHGGPAGVQDTTDFSPLIQYLSSRGYSVLQVNFRGSAGKGSKFEDAGAGQMGLRIEGDIITALNKHLATHSYDNMCAIGASYGAYSAMALAMHQPDMFDCVIGTYGVYDPALLLKEDVSWATKKWYKKYWNPKDKQVQAKAPINNTHLLKAPALLIAGAVDEIAPIEHTESLQSKLVARGHDVTVRVYDNVGHGSASPYIKLHESAIIDQFIRDKLSLAPLTIDDASQAAIAQDIGAIGYGYASVHYGGHNPTKAFELLARAVELGSDEAALDAFHAHTILAYESDRSILTPLLVQARSTGDDASIRLSELYIDEQFGTPDASRAIEHAERFKRASGSLSADLLLSRLYCADIARDVNSKRCVSQLDATFGRHQKRLEFIPNYLSVAYAHAVTGEITDPDTLDRFHKFASIHLDMKPLPVKVKQISKGTYGPVVRYYERGDWIRKILDDGNEIDIASLEDDSVVGIRVDLSNQDKNATRLPVVVRWTNSNPMFNGKHIDIDTEVRERNNRDYFTTPTKRAKPGDIWQVELIDVTGEVLVKERFRFSMSSESKDT